MDFLRNRGHPPKTFSTQAAAALSFRNSLTDTYLIKFQLVLPNLLLVFVSSVHWPQEGFVCLKPCLIFFSYGSRCNKRSITAACKLCLACILTLLLQQHNHYKDGISLNSLSKKRGPPSFSFFNSDITCKIAQYNIFFFTSLILEN